MQILDDITLQDVLLALADRVSKQGDDPEMAVILMAAARLTKYPNLKKVAAGMVWNFAMEGKSWMDRREKEMRVR